MNVKKLIATVLVGASLLVFAGIASATMDTPDMEINVYGASAQYTFWNSLAPNFIKAQSGCSGAAPSVATNGTTNTVTFATCGGHTYHVRVSNKASFDGVYSLLGNDTYATAGATAEKCSSTDVGYPGTAAAAKYYRKLAQSDGTLACEKIMVGASDVAGESFDQISWGSQHGPADAGGTNQITRNIGSINTATLPHANPFVVPFSFYVNNTVKEGGVTIDNLTRLQAVLLFSGEIMNWNQFGVSFANQPTTICLRHAGSGTHATLDYAVVRGNGWGGTLVQNENRIDDPANYDPGTPTIFFNDTTGDEEYCVNTQAGAVGYFDADKANATTHLIIASGYPNILQVAYQGEYASADGIQHGRYDFFTNEWAYKDPSLSGGALTLVNNFLAYAAGNIPSSESSYWVDQTQMKFNKATDQQYPH